MSLRPTLLWAQRKQVLHLKIELSDVSNPQIALTENKLTFSGQSHCHNYALDIHFFAPINVEESRYTVGARHIQFQIRKKEEGWWDACLKDKAKPAFLKVDWSLWKDEDEDVEPASMPIADDFNDFGDEPADDGPVDDEPPAEGADSDDDSEDADLEDLDPKETAEASEKMEPVALPETAVQA
eukprot:CAMPEP_0196658090 /NCGR_PEP_ID=MMETSP1086-20130531/27182_1 /TAXON_ID=77921 /ORGANISM="Cyanoptyche  gloeocystis , Strain SAG4.97" /LENGTH=182 /DNA_ID=CAMNT_0041991497 /DNA_START=52 /DNA_END=600 /DNA_ORIENTATION=+